MKQCDLSRLLENSVEKFYWLGFLMADGSFNTKNRLKVCLAEKDLHHLKQLKDFLRISSPIVTHIVNNRKYCGISAMDTVVLKEVRQQFAIDNNKTINPCSLSNLTEEQLFCVSVGFIDGDGSISKVHNRIHAQLTVKCHSNWLGNLRMMFPDASVRHDSHGYAKASITNSEILKRLKLRAIELSLPIMKRKWDNIDISFTSAQQRTKENLPVIVEMLQNGYSKKEVCVRFGYTKAALSILLKRKGLR